MTHLDILDRIRGALFGVAVGDALGGPVEFMNADQIKKKHGRVTEMIGGGWLGLEPGEVTDDTQMTMAVALGIEEDPYDPVPAIGRRFVGWYDSGPKDIGGTCSKAIYTAKVDGCNTAKDWVRAGHKTDIALHGRSAGNGALMRTVYTGLYYADATERKAKTHRIAEMTHCNNESSGCCIRYADMVHAAIFGGHPISLVMEKDIDATANPTGYVKDTWYNVIDSILQTETFEDAVVEAVNRGGDADTIGAITGGLAGAYYGYKAIPQRWISTLDESLKKDMDRLAEVAYNANREYYRNHYKAPAGLLRMLQEV